MLCGVEEALDVQQLRCGCRIEGFEDDFKEQWEDMVGLMLEGNVRQ